MRQKGKITNWNDDKGYGFIKPAGGGQQIFIHIKAFKNRNSRPEINQTVSYDIARDKQGRICAENAFRSGSQSPDSSKRKKAVSSILIVFSFVVFLVFSIMAAKLPVLVLAFYGIISLFTFILYAIDKTAAENGDWRTSESTLHFFSLIGGWPGALIAQQKLRHKSNKQSFRAVFWLTVLVNFTAFIWLLTPAGNTALQSVTFNMI